MKHTLAIKTPEIAARAQAIIASLPLDPIHEVVIRPHKGKRSLDQNALLWKWNTYIGVELGYDSEEMHEILKAMFLPGVYRTFLENEEEDQDWKFVKEHREILDTLDKLRQEGQEEAAAILHKQVSRMLSTASLGVQRMTIYMNAVSRHAGSLGIRLPHPEDRGR
ncbi:MAG: recombination protein NinB [Desulfobulbaceae bacterium]|nr:recombination protein NinB [Desulfobulbaceae bacterium]